jgi:hypothetical protein
VEVEPGAHFINLRSGQKVFGLIFILVLWATLCQKVA